jgi:Cu(I)/Ag(I) efflux system membrane fusion protein
MTAKSVLLLPVMLLAVALAFVGCKESDSGSAGQKYHCPMHPTYVSDKPGDCPICNMKLVPIKDEKAAAKPVAPGAADKIAQVKPGQFYCPMGAEHVQDTPGECPKCGMKLIEKKETPAGHEGHAASAPAAPVPGRIAISLDADKKQMIGLTTALVEKRELIQPVRTTATFEHDETKLARIAPRFGGWVRKLKINFTGQHVEKGEPLLTVYSPELYAAETEYLIAYQSFQQLKNNPSDPKYDSARRLHESAQRKLALWEIGEQEVRELEQTGHPKDELLLRSPVSGHVVTKTAIAGRSFMAGDTLYEIADLSHLWLRAYVFEFELPLIKVGQKARALLPYLGNQTYESTITFIYPHIDPLTRRAEIRLEVENPKLELRPQMWASVELDASFGEVLTVPASALIDTGPRHVAFVLRDDDHLEPREVKIGAKTDDYYEVRDGLKAGEKVVVRALFLVDSESQLKAAISGMGAAGGHQH